MEPRIEELLDKYWKGETSLDEELEVKKHFTENPSLTETGQYFRAIAKQEQVNSERVFKHPAKIGRTTWWSVAATVALGCMVALAVFQDAKKQRDFQIDDPQQAYEITRKALMMVSSSLNEGKIYSNELQKLNEVEEILKD